MGAIALRVFGVLLMLTALAIPLMQAPDRAVETLVAQWAPPPSDFLELKGQLVHFRDEGVANDPLPIVLLHGTASSLHTWEGWAKALRGQRRVITIDLPGFGLTGPFAGSYAGKPYISENYAGFVLDFLDARGVKRFAVGGNSLGGQVAWHVAAAAPGRVDRLILVDSSGYPVEPASVPLGLRVAALPGASQLAQYLLPRALVVASVRSAYGDPARISDELVERYYELLLRDGNRRALGERMRELGRDADAAPIAGLKLPTLILWGGRDRLIPPSVAQRFKADIAGSQLVVFDSLGHVPQEEDPAATVAPVKRFLGLPP